MRMLSASVVLSSMVLGGWLAAAKAQNVDLDNPPALNQSGEAEGSGVLPGHILQPSINSPGLVAGVTLGQLYTDNLRLAHGDTPKQSGWITQVQPFVRAAASRPRFSGVFDYKLNGYLYEEPSGHEQLTHNLRAYGTLAILPEHFFLAGTALYGQQIINNQLPGGGGTFFLTGNRANVGAVTLGPSWQQDLGNVGTMLLRYTHGRVVYNHHGIQDESRGVLNGIPDVTTDAVQLNLESPKYQTWGWHLRYSEERLDPDFGRGWDFAIATVGGSFQVNDSLRLLAEGGKENDFRPDGTVEKLGATFWDAGFEWSNRRDHVRFTAGHRFFGHTYQLSWTHEAALLTTNVSYVERPTNYNQELAGASFGAGGLPPIDIIGPGTPSLTERQPFVMKRLSASATYLMPRSRLRVELYDASRTFFTQQGKQERLAGADVSWFFNLGALTTLTPSVRWQRSKFEDGQVNNTRYAQVALVHRINAKNFGSLRVRHDVTGVSNPSAGANGYTANVIFVQWTHLF